MADTITGLTNPTQYADLTDQQIADVGRRIEIGAKAVDDLTQFFEAETFPDGRKDAAFRMLVPQRIAEDDVSSFELKENVAPANRTLKYATYRKTIKPYGTRYEYTREAVEDAPDNVVSDCADELDSWATQIKQFSASSALKATKSAITYSTSLMNTFDKAFALLSSVVRSKKWIGNRYLCIMPGVLEINLKNELLAANNGQTLTQEEKEKAYQGYIGSYDSFDIVAPTDGSDFLEDDTNYYVYFIGKDRKGRNPLRILRKNGKWTEVIHNGLGSGLLKNAAQELVPDYNKQKGAVAMNMAGFQYYIRDDRYVVLCKIAKTDIATPTIDSTAVTTLDKALEDLSASSSVSPK